MDEDKQGWDKIAQQERKHKRTDKALKVGGGALSTIGYLMIIMIVLCFIAAVFLFALFGS